MKPLAFQLGGNVTNLLRRLISVCTDKRNNHRYSLIGSIPGEFTNSEGTPYLIHPIDISEGGLGVLINPAPQLGDRIIYQADFLSSPIYFVVRHVNTPDIALSSLEFMRRCGLERVGKLNVLYILGPVESLMIQE